MYTMHYPPWHPRYTLPPHLAPSCRGTLPLEDPEKCRSGSEDVSFGEVRHSVPHFSNNDRHALGLNLRWDGIF